MWLDVFTSLTQRVQEELLLNLLESPASHPSIVPISKSLPTGTHPAFLPHSVLSSQELFGHVI